jgi:long-subunit fatty acid transport protein
MLRGRSLARAIGVVAFVGATVGASTASAQVDYEIMASLQFNFSNPGARSLAMAGALTGAGDDATGAWTNPGGLTNISRPEIGIEFRGFDFTTPFVSAGRFNGTPENIGRDTVSGLIYGESANDTSSLAFVSAVVPKSRFAFAFYRTELANFETNIFTDGAFFEAPGAGVSSRAFPLTGDLSLKIANLGGSAAVRLTDQVSVGVGVSFYDFELDSLSHRFFVSDIASGAPGDLFGEPLRDGRFLIDGGDVFSREFITGDDSAVGVNVGASISPSDTVRIGASYRQGPKFDISYERFGPFGTRVCPAGESCSGPSTGTFRVPDVISVGALVKPMPTLNVTVDFRRVMYSQITEEMGAGFGGDPADYFAEDGSEIRAAAEYLFTDVPEPLSAIAVRGGVWRDTDHRIRYNGPFSTDTVLYASPLEDETHVTFGGGVVFNRAQFDIGFDRSERVKTFAVSASFRF